MIEGLTDEDRHSQAWASLEKCGVSVDERDALVDMLKAVLLLGDSTDEEIEKAEEASRKMQEKAEKVCAAGGRGDGIPARTTGKDVTPVKDSTTVVIDKFRSAPLQDLKVEDVPFIGPVTAQNMFTTKNITTAEELLGYFLFLGPRDPSPQVSSESVAGMHEERFKNWLKDECKVTGSVAQKVYRSLVAKADVVCIV